MSEILLNWGVLDQMEKHGDFVKCETGQTGS